MSKVIQAGVAKSGNYWLWKIIDLTLKESSGSPSKFITTTDEYHNLSKEIMSHSDQIDIDVLDVEMTGFYWRVGPFIKKRLRNVDDYLDLADHVWTHSSYCKKFKNIFTGVNKIIYIIRHPVDIAKSQANFAFTPYVMNGAPSNEKNPNEHFKKRLEWSLISWTQHVSGWLAFRPKNSHIIFYENLKEDFDNEYGKLLKYLEIKLSDEQLQIVKESVHIKAMHSKNPNHVRVDKAEIILDENQKELVDEIAGPLLKKLKYSDAKKIFNYPNIFSEEETNTFKEFNKKSSTSISYLLRGTFYLIFSNRTFKDKVIVVKRKVKHIFGQWINILGK